MGDEAPTKTSEPLVMLVPSSNDWPTSSTMTESELKFLVADLFLKGDRAYPLAADTDLLEEGICDSLGLVTIVTELEQRNPGLRILDQDVTRVNFGSIRSILNFLSVQR
jgi:acyl carrier protein